MNEEPINKKLEKEGLIKEESTDKESTNKELTKDIFTAGGRQCMAYICGEPEYLLIQPVDEHDMGNMDDEMNLLSKQSDKEFILVAVQALDWNGELSPWEAEPAFGDEKFAGHAEDMLSFIENVLISNICNRYGWDEDISTVIGGYSLAGLFALWCSYQTDRFAAVAAASPSVWFDGWLEYIESLLTKSPLIYLSLGDREEKTRNSRMRVVGDNIRRQSELLVEQGVRTALEWNSGGHFNDTAARTARGFIWCLNEL